MAATIRQIQTALDNARAAGDQTAVVRLTQILEKAKAAGAPEGGMPWSEVAGRAIQNTPKSLYNYGADLVTAVTNPLQTADVLLDATAGGISRGIEGVTGLDIFPENKATATADVVGGHYKDRYGSWDGFKRAIAEDPVGVASDLSLPVTGAGGIAARAGGTVGRLGRVTRVAGDLMDPISAAGRTAQGAGRVVSAGAGWISGMGEEPARSIFNARRAGGEQAAAATRGMREPPRGNEVVQEAMDKSGVLAEDARGRYTGTIAATKGSQARINWNNIFRSIYDTIRSNMTTRGGRFYGGPTGRQMVQDILEVTQQYVMDPSLHNLEGLDALKQELQLLQHPIGANPVRGAENANRLVTRIIDGIRGEIVRLEPSYATVEADYARFKDLQNELRNTLSLNDKASTDTALRKLQSTMRNNVQANYGQRTQLLDELDSVHRPSRGLHRGTLRAELAGQAANTWMPRGIARAGGAMAVPAFLSWLSSSPGMAMAALPFIPAAMPRVVGESAGALGDMMRLFDRGASNVPRPARQAARAATSRTGRQALRQSGVAVDQVEGMIQDANGNWYDRKGRLIQRAPQ